MTSVMHERYTQSNGKMLKPWKMLWEENVGGIKK